MLWGPSSWRNQARLHQIQCFLIGYPEVVFFFSFDVFHPSVANLLAGKHRSLVLKKEFLVDVLDVRIVIRSPKRVFVGKHKVNGRGEVARNSCCPDAALIGFAPVGTGVKRSRFDVSNISDFIHFRHKSGPVGNAGC